MIKYFLYAVTPCIIAYTRGDGVIQSMWEQSPIVVIMIALMSYGGTWLVHVFVDALTP